MQLSPDQKSCLEQLYSWFKNDRSTPMTMGGYAGVGKTTLIAVFRRLLNAAAPKLKVAFCSFTGKATRVLHQKLHSQAVLLPKDSVSTIHSLIYSPIVDNKQKIIGWKLKEELKYDLIIVDEASMVSQSLWNDLTSFQVPVLAVGDHGQLPPIEAGFSLMQAPTIKLEKIHRQAIDNPIIQVSLLARENGYIPPRFFSSSVIKYDRQHLDTADAVESLLQRYKSTHLVLCGYNKTRVQLNQYIRQIVGFETALPQEGDRVICLKNNPQKSLFNGMLGTIQSLSSIDSFWYQAEIKMDDSEALFSGAVFKTQFSTHAPTQLTEGKVLKQGDFFDFGYALTVHKSQGSQASRVILFEERFPKMDDDLWRRWLYTGVTRAEEELFIVGAGKSSSQ